MSVEKVEDLIPGNVKGAMTAAEASSSDLWMVPMSEIRVIEGFNVRKHNDGYKAHIRALADSIKANGFYRNKALAGYVAKETAEDGSTTNVIYITDGHSRLAAAHLAAEEGADLSLLPVVVAPKGTSTEDLTVSLVTQNSGRPLEPLEVAEVCKRLVGFGWEEKQIAERLGFSKNHVTNLLALIAGPAPLRKMVEKGQVSATLAIETLKKGTKAIEKLKETVSKASSEGKKKVTKKALRDEPKAKPAKGRVIDVMAAETEGRVALTIEIDGADAEDFDIGQWFALRSVEAPKAKTEESKADEPAQGNLLDDNAEPAEEGAGEEL